MGAEKFLIVMCQLRSEDMRDCLLISINKYSNQYSLKEHDNIKWSNLIINRKSHQS